MGLGYSNNLLSPAILKSLEIANIAKISGLVLMADESACTLTDVAKTISGRLLWDGACKTVKVWRILEVIEK